MSLKKFEKKVEEDAPIKNPHRIKSFLSRNPKGIIIYQDDPAVIAAYKKIDAYNIFKNRKTLKIKDTNNINLISLYLSKNIKKKFSASELSNIYTNNRSELFINMLIRVHGFISSFPSEKSIIIQKDDHKIEVKFKEKPIIYKEHEYIKDKYIFIIGNILSLGKSLEIEGITIIL